MNVWVEKVRTAAVDLSQVRARRGMVLLIALCVAWLIPGLYGHEPWDPHEPLYLGLISNIITTGDWTVLAVAGDHYTAALPLFPVSVALFAELFRSFPLHELARTVSACYTLIALLFIWLTGREITREETAAAAVVVAVGSLGLQDPSHRIMAGPAILAGFAMAIYGMALFRRREILGAFWLGTGAGVAFLSGGLLFLAAIAGTVAILPLVSSTWRSKSYGEALGFAGTFLLPWLLVWPGFLWLRSPVFFIDWLHSHIFGGTLAGNGWGLGMALLHLLWFTFPLLPLALWGIWKRRRQWRGDGISILGIAFAVPLLLAVLLTPVGMAALLPLLIPLSFLAASALQEISEHSLPWLNGTLIGIFALSAALLWLGWGVLQTGYPPSLATHLLGIRPTYAPVFTPGFFWGAAFTTAAWGAVTFLAGKGPFSLLLRWTSGVVLLWTLLMTLWLPWIDAGYSYRTAFLSLSDAIADRSHCISSKGLTVSHQALLQYYADIVTEPVETGPELACDLMVVQGVQDISPGKEWVKIWEGGRPHVDDERFALWSREKRILQEEEGTAKEEQRRKKRRKPEN